MADGRLNAPSAERNTASLVETLRPCLAGLTGTALEIGSGTGQHVAAYATAFPHLVWQPSDATADLFDSIRAWQASADGHLRDPLVLDAAGPWPELDALSLVISANVIHIAPWAVAQGIVNGAGNTLSQQGLLAFYGPFRENGAHTGDGNASFDQSLRTRDPEWGIRDLEALAKIAEEAGFGPPATTVMPANNRLVVFRKR